jgi:hypothetical protein
VVQLGLGECFMRGFATGTEDFKGVGDNEFYCGTSGSNAVPRDATTMTNLFAANDDAAAAAAALRAAERVPSASSPPMQVTNQGARDMCAKRFTLHRIYSPSLISHQTMRYNHAHAFSRITRTQCRAQCAFAMLDTPLQAS